MIKYYSNKILFVILDTITFPIGLLGILYYFLLEVPFINGRIRAFQVYTDIVKAAHPTEVVDNEPDEHEDIDKQ